MPHVPLGPGKRGVALVPRAALPVPPPGGPELGQAEHLDPLEHPPVVGQERRDVVPPVLGAAYRLLQRPARGGVPLDLVLEVPGHTDIVTTKWYIHRSLDESSPNSPRHKCGTSPAA